MPRNLNPALIEIGAGTVAAKTVDDNAFKYPERDVDPLRVHLHDPSRAHMAEAIGIVDAADCYTSDEVEGALQEICAGMGAGRMNGLIEGGYLVAPVTAGSSYPHGGPGLELRLVAVTDPSGHPSTVLINAHILDISGFTYDFQTGLDPNSGVATSIAGTYYLYLETDPAAAAPNLYETLVASTTLPTVASEKIHIAQITHDGINLTNVIDCRYFVANLDRKLPYTLRSGFPKAFTGEDSDTWGEALFQTLEAALWWIENYDGPGSTQEEKGTIIVRGVQVVSQRYTLRAGTCLMGSGPDATIRYEGTDTGAVFTIAGSDIRIQDLTIDLKQDVPGDYTAIACAADVEVSRFVMERCRVQKNGTVSWRHAVDFRLLNTDARVLTLSDCYFEAEGTSGIVSPVLYLDLGDLATLRDVRISSCVINGDGGSVSGIWVSHINGLLIEGCRIEDPDPDPGGGARGIYVEESTVRCTITDTFVDKWTIGIFLSGGTVGTVVKNCTIGSALVGDTIGIHAGWDALNPTAGNMTGLEITGNHVIGQQTDPGARSVDFECFGIQIQGLVVGPRICDNNVVGNWYNSNAGNAGAATLGGALGITRSALGDIGSEYIVTGNRLQPGVVVDENVSGLVFADNIVVTLATDVNWKNDQLAIGVNAHNISVTGNVFEGNRQALCGVAVFGSKVVGKMSDTVTISGNTVHDHNETGILIGGLVANAVISGNVIETTYDDTNLPSAIGIHCFGLDAVGAALSPSITGNTISRMARGIAVTGTSSVDPLTRPDQINITGNTINWCAVSKPQPNFSDWDDMYAQGIVIAYGRAGVIEGNVVAGIGAIINDAGSPVLPDLGSWAAGIQCFRSELINIGDNSVADLFSYNLGWSIGIHVDCFSKHAQTFNDISVHGNTVNLAELGTGNDVRMACIAVWASDTLSATASTELQNISIKGNVLRGTDNVDPTKLFADLQRTGACSILYYHAARKNTGRSGNVAISDNSINHYGANGVCFTISGNDTADISAEVVLISDNVIHEYVGGTTYVNEESLTKDAAILALAQGGGKLEGLTIADNNLSNFAGAGICVGATGETGLLGSAVHDAVITGNIIPHAQVLEAEETYGILLQTFGNVQTQTSLGRILISDNVIGKFTETPQTDNTIYWGVFVKPYFDANQTGTFIGNIQVNDNIIHTVFGGVSFDLDAVLTLTRLYARDIGIKGNSIVVPINQGGSAKHTSVDNYHIGFRSSGYTVRNIHIHDNVCRPHPNDVPDMGWRSTIPLRFQVEGDSNSLEPPISVEHISVRDNYLQGARGDSTSTYSTEGILWATMNNPVCRDWAFENNQIPDQSNFGWNADADADVDMKGFRFCGNQSVGVSESIRALNLNFHAVDGHPQSPDLGARDIQILDNQFRSPGAIANTEFLAAVSVYGVHMTNLSFDGNMMNMVDTGQGGFSFLPSGTQTIRNFSCSRNTFLSSERPHIWFGAGDQAVLNGVDTSVAVVHIDDNICDGILFPVGGWSATYHPDAAIIYEGCSVVAAGAVATDVHGDLQISICGNQIRNLISADPDITDPEGVGVKHSVIYVGPNPLLNYNDGDGPSEYWPQLRGLRIDGNTIHQCQVDRGIYTNFLVCAREVANISVCDNTIGRGTQDNLTDELSPNYGIYFQGKELFSVYVGFGDGMRDIAVSRNRIWLLGGDGNAAWDKVYGIVIDYRSQWDEGAYRVDGLSVDDNLIAPYIRGQAGLTYGILCNLSAHTVGFSCSGNDLTLGGDNILTYDWTAGIKVWHAFDGSSGDGTRLRPATNNARQATYDAAQGVWLLGWPDDGSGTIPRVLYGDDDMDDFSAIAWENFVLQRNTVYGAAMQGSVLMGGINQNSAFYFSPIRYLGNTIAGDTRRMTIMPCYNLNMSYNSCKSSRLVYAGQFATDINMGFRFMYTSMEFLIGGISNLIVLSTSYVFRGWIVQGNSAMWYSVTNDETAQPPGNMEGYDVSMDEGGWTVAPIRISGMCEGNLSNQNALGNVGWVGVAGGWTPIATENFNDYPWIKL